MWPNAVKAVFAHRPRLLWLVLGAMLLVSVFPLALYHRQVLRLSNEKLTDTESVQQTEVTRAVGDEIELFDANLKQQLISERQILALIFALTRTLLSEKSCNVHFRPPGSP
jgi:hypothetical protein